MDTEGFKELRHGPLGYSIEGPQSDMPAGFSEWLENKLLPVGEIHIVWPWRDGNGRIGRIRGTKDGSLLKHNYISPFKQYSGNSGLRDSRTP